MKTALLTCAWALLLAVLGAGVGPADEVRVLKHGDLVYIRTAFSPTEDLVVRVGKGANRQINFNNAYLVSREAGMTVQEMEGWRLIHANGDDSTPWNLNGTYIGANHGCSDARQVICPGHGRDTADLGTVWQDAAGGRFVLVKIADANCLWFLSVNEGKGEIWQFNRSMPTTPLTRADGATINFSEAKMVQLIPACRISRQEYLADGQRPIVEDAPVSCAHFDIVEDYDIISPAAVVQDLLEHPGQERSFVAEHLAAVVSNHIVYCFQPNGACVISHRAQALQSFNLGYMGFIQSAKLACRPPYTSHLYYIPKTMPFTQDGTLWDFRAGADYRAAPQSPLIFAADKGNIQDPANLPDRFIQLLGHEENGRVVHDVGFALGYSLAHGITVPERRAANAGRALMLYTSAKSYPTAVDGKMGNPIAAGTEFSCVAYRQYFWPGAQPGATCFYWHEEEGEVFVYADFHRAVEREILALPQEWAGRKLSVVEQTPSVSLHAGDTMPQQGVAITVTGDYGYVVLRVE